MIKRGFLHPRTKGILRLGIFVVFLLSFALGLSKSSAAAFSVNLSSSVDPADSQIITLAASLEDPNINFAKTSYTFWWNCKNNYSTVDYASIVAACGVPETIIRDDLPVDQVKNAVGRRFENIWTGSQADGTAQLVNAKTALKIGYPTGQVTAIVLIERRGAATDKKLTFDVMAKTAPSLTARLAGGTGGVAPYSSKNTAYATSVNNTGNYGYYFYCNRSDSGTTTGALAPFETALAKVQSSWTMVNACSYTNPGTYSPKVIVKQGTLSAENRMNITVTQPPTVITPSLALNPNPSDTTKQVTLTGTASTNNVTDSINYSFWWNCASATTTYSQAVTDCGDPSNATIGAKFNAQSVSTVSKSTQHLYSQVGTYKPKVLIEQGNASAVSSQSLAVATPQFFDASLSSSASPSNSQEITLSANLRDSNTAFAKTNYTFWWNCKNNYSTVDYASIVSACGEPDSVRDDLPVDQVKNVVGRRFENIWTGSQADGTAQLVNAKTALKMGYPTGQVAAVVLIERRGVAVDKKFTFNVVPAPTPSVTPSPALTPSATALPSASPSPTATASIVLPTLTADLNLAPAQSVPGGTVTLNALTQSNTASGNYNYYFWWNCDAPQNSTLASIKNLCQDPSNASIGAQFINISQSNVSKSVAHIYLNAGTYKPLVYVEHAGLNKTATSTMNVVKPTLVAGLRVNPTTADGSAKPATLTASAGGTATGSVNYTFWWNCNESGTNLADLTAKCGDPGSSVNGGKYVENSNQKITSHDYIQAGTFYPKLVIERGSADSQEARSQIVINAIPIPTLNVSLGATKTSAENVLPANVDITANISGNATGITNYKIWWDCQPNTQDYSLIEGICGSTSDVSKGTALTSAANELTKKVSTSYNIAGLRHPFVLAERNSIKSIASTEINIPQVIIPDTLTAALSASPTSIKAGETAKLKASTTSNNSKDAYSYYFWWNCPDADSKVLSDVIAACGNPSDSNYGQVFLGQSSSTTSKEISHQYTSADRAYPRVFVEHGSVSANSKTELLVSDVGIDETPTPMPSPSASPSALASPTPSPVITPSPTVLPSVTLSKPAGGETLRPEVTNPMTIGYSNLPSAKYNYMLYACPGSVTKCSAATPSNEVLRRGSDGNPPSSDFTGNGSVNLDVSLSIDGKGNQLLDDGDYSLGATFWVNNTIYDSATKLVHVARTHPSVTPTPSPTPDTLIASLTAGPDTGFNPIRDITLTAKASGTANGTINYTFYCDRSDDGTDIQPGYISKFDSVMETEKVLPNSCTYDKAGTYSAKVIIERGSAPAAQAKALITVKQSSGIRLKELAIKAYPEATKPGTAIQIKTSVVDIYGNVYDDNGHLEGSNKLDGLQIFVTLPDPRAGKLGSNSSSTFLETSDNLGVYPVEGSALFEDQVLKQSVNITITNEIPVLTSVLIKARDSFMNQIIPGTNNFRIKPNGYLRLYATPLDQFGQWFANANMKYEFSSSAGAIQPNGLIQAGTNEGTFNSAFKAIATSSDNTVAATSNLIVTNDVEDDGVCSGEDCPVPTDPTCNPCPPLANKLCEQKPLVCIGKYCLLPACKEPNCTNKSACIGSYCLQSSCLSEVTKEDCPVPSPTPTITPTAEPTSSATMTAEPTPTATTTSSAEPTIIPTPSVETSSTIQVVEVKIEPENPSVEKLSTKQFTASVYLDNEKIAESTVTNASAPNAEFAWISSNVGSIDVAGKFIAGDSTGSFNSAVRVNATVMINGEPRIVVGVTDISILDRVCTGPQCDICPDGVCSVGDIILPKVIGEAINSVSSHNTNIPPVAGAVALAVLAVSAAAPLVANAGAMSGLIGKTSNLFFFLPFGPRRRKNYGSVVDASTGYGIQGVIVGVINLESGKEVLRSTTDHLGRFSILVPSGKYMLNISSKDYQMAELPGYYKPRTTIEINQSAKTPVTPKIALLQSSKTLSRKLKVVSLLDSLQKIVFPLSTIALVWGTYISYLQVPQRTKSANAMLFTFYAVVWGIWVASLIKKRLRNFGVVKSGSSSVDRAVIRIFDKNNRLVSTTVSDRDGRFSVMLPKGEYIIKVVAPGMVQSSEVKAIVREELGPLSANIQLHKA